MTRRSFLSSKRPNFEETLRMKVKVKMKVNCRIWRQRTAGDFDQNAVDRGRNGQAWLKSGSRTFEDSANLDTLHVSSKIMPISSASAVFREFSSSRKAHSHLTAKTVKAVASRRPQRCVRDGVLPKQSEARTLEYISVSWVSREEEARAPRVCAGCSSSLGGLSCRACITLI